jgi:hypothetical protein
VIEKYTGVLGAVNVFTVPIAFTILESIRLDPGYHMDVHRGVREIFQSSDTTTVHMKDRASGPDGFLPFVRSLLRGIDD